MRKSILATAFLGTAILAGGLGAVASHEAAPGGRFGHSPMGKLIMARMGRMMTLKAELDLTDAQKEAIKSTVQSHKSELANAIKPAVEAHRALRDRVLADSPDDASIRKAADDMGKKIGDAAVVIAKVKAEAAEKAKLTPEQKKKIDAFRTANDESVDEFLAKVGKAE